MRQASYLARRIPLAASRLVLALAAACLLPTFSYGFDPAPTNSLRSIRRDKADPFFESGVIPTLRIEISAAGMEELRHNPRNYVKARIRDGDKTVSDVGIHVKGAAGSSRSIDDRPALTLNLDKFIPGQSLFGLSKFHLNNSVQDPSYMTELLCSELFLAAGVPAARTTHAVVELNGRKLGLYVLKEGFGKQFLKRHFKNATGNLYDGGFLRDISEPLQKISGDEGEGQPAADRLVKACDIEDPAQRLAAIGQRLDLDRFVSFLALEMMTWHWDGYLMKKNNYRVYHDPESDRVVFFPHGMDQMFWSANGTVRPGADGLVAQAVLNTPAGAAMFRDRAAWLTTNLFLASLLTNRMTQIYERIHPALASVEPDQAMAHEESFRNLRRQVAQRAAFLGRRFGARDTNQLAFDAKGELSVKGWKSRLDAGEARFSDQAVNGTRVLGIEVTSTPVNGKEAKLQESCVASYRVVLHLSPGRYALIGRVRTEGVEVAGKLVRGSGAGLRVSQRRRTNALSGDTPWQEVTHEFVVEDPDEEIELICDLRAKKGRAFFESDSLRVRKLVPQLEGKP